jgi:hypothetical protein
MSGWQCSVFNSRKTETSKHWFTNNSTGYAPDITHSKVLINWHGLLMVHGLNALDRADLFSAGASYRLVVRRNLSAAASKNYGGASDLLFGEP